MIYPKLSSFEHQQNPKDNNKEQTIHIIITNTFKSFNTCNWESFIAFAFSKSIQLPYSFFVVAVRQWWIKPQEKVSFFVLEMEKVAGWSHSHKRSSNHLFFDAQAL
ncbi:hypothetical protein LXL04_003687 [Taraxacum kok-saghyz]